MIRVSGAAIAPLDPKLKVEKLARARSVLAGLGVKEVRVAAPTSDDALEAIEDRAAKAEGRIKVLEAKVAALDLVIDGMKPIIVALSEAVDKLEAARPAGALEGPPVPSAPQRRKRASSSAGPKPWEVLGIPESTYYRKKKDGKL